MSGAAPLTVNFDGTGSHEPAGGCATISSYAIDYGDGTGGSHDVQTNNTGHFAHTFTAVGEYIVRLVVTDTNTKTSTNVAQQVIDVGGGAPPVAGVVSRKTHGSAGTFDIQMPLTGTVGIEDRTGQPSIGSHNLIVVLQSPVTSVGSLSATATTSGGTTNLPPPTYTIGTGAQNNQISVNLTGVPNAAHVFLTLHTVADTAGNSGDVVVPADFLLGDTTADRSVNSADISQTKAQSGRTVSGMNFREDVTADGSLNSADISFVKSKSGTALP